MAPVQYIYVIECAGFHKVGKAFNVPLRLDGLRTGNPFPMMCVYSIAVVHDMARRIEKRAHHALAAHHHRGEWFAVPLGVCRSAVDEAVAWSIMPQNSGRDYKAREVDVAQPVMAGGPVGGNQGGDYVQHAMAVRRLTPKEAARLQGFPDDYLDITYRSKPAADGPKYRALGNSMAVPVMRWIGRRIHMVDDLTRSAAA